MTYPREPVLQPVPIESLRPTQITVGMREVEEKRKRLRKQKPRKIGSFIGHHMIPVVLIGLPIRTHQSGNVCCQEVAVNEGSACSATTT